MKIERSAMEDNCGMNAIDCLLMSTEPWTKYRALVDLLAKNENDTETQNARTNMVEHPLVQGLISELQSWPGLVLSSHKSAGQLYHKLAFLADLGLKEADTGIGVIVEKVTAHKTSDGIMTLPINIPKHFGGTGAEQYAWALCDAPVLLYAVSKIQSHLNQETLGGIEALLNLARENGWPCSVSKELGSFRGPGSKTDPCPYATLVMLKLLAQTNAYEESEQALAGCECLLTLWENSRQKHPFMFYMGNDFRKLKAPFIWYDILHLADVLSQYKTVLADDRFLDMLDVINGKIGSDGLFTPESEWKAWQGWDFGQKKKPSSWLTLLVYRINRRVGKDGL
jgi:hypothetical protein